MGGLPISTLTSHSGGFNSFVNLFYLFQCHLIQLIMYQWIVTDSTVTAFPQTRVWVQTDVHLWCLSTPLSNSITLLSYSHLIYFVHLCLNKETHTPYFLFLLSFNRSQPDAPTSVFTLFHTLELISISSCNAHTCVFTLQLIIHNSPVYKSEIYILPKSTCWLW